MSNSSVCRQRMLTHSALAHADSALLPPGRIAYRACDTCAAMVPSADVNGGLQVVTVSIRVLLVRVYLHCDAHCYRPSLGLGLSQEIGAWSKLKLLFDCMWTPSLRG